MDKLISFAIGLITGTALYASLDKLRRPPLFFIDNRQESKKQNGESDPDEED